MSMGAAASWNGANGVVRPIAVIGGRWQREGMEIVYVLHHVRADDEHGDDAKLIGVYRSLASARAAQDHLRKQPGFRDYPEGFQCDPYRLDEDHWIEGFGVNF
jgi:hypothetical protein